MFGRTANETERVRRNFDLSCFPSNDPVENLSIEQSIFSEFSSSNGRELLLFYVNRSSLVYGKHQNPWAECSPNMFFREDVSLMRRFSGGGCVYHDVGNMNWSFISPRDGFSQEENLLIIADLAARYSGLKFSDFHLSDRGDIFWRDKKVSGNALAFRGDKALHHGTLLINTRLDSLGGALKGIEKRYRCRIEGTKVDSNPSPVVDLSAASGRKLNCDDFIKAALSELGKRHGSRFISPPVASDELLEQYRSEDWHFRRTPTFRIILDEGLVFRVEQGIARFDDPQTPSQAESRWDLAQENGLRTFINMLTPAE